MLEDIVITVISSIITAFLLEWFKPLRKKLRPAKKSAIEDSAGMQKNFTLDVTPQVFSFARTITAILAGFFFSAIVAGILEAEELIKIEFGSTAMVGLSVIGTALCWSLTANWFTHKTIE